ncbi:MAG: C13 family peptidase, partial [Candidatus Hodarchaeales archaeon]
ISMLFQYQGISQLNDDIQSLEESFPHSITEFKGPLREKFLGKKVTVEGYLTIIDNRYPILVQNLNLLKLNLPIPEDRFLPLLEFDINELDDLEGALLRVKGILTLDEDILKLKPPPDIPEIIIVDWGWRWCYILRKWEYNFTFPSIYSNNYAVLISGGYNQYNAHDRYWNDLKEMYAILVNLYSYNPNRITVIYKDGIGEDSDMPVHYSATNANVTKVFTDLAGSITNQEKLFVFTTNHGGGFHPTDPYGNYNYGLIDDDGDEPEAGYSEQGYGIDFNSDGDTLDTVQIDEVLCLYYNQLLRDDDLADLVDQINCEELIIVMEQCFSGGFIHDLSGNNRTILTACIEEEFSWGADTEGDFDEFVFQFMVAVNTTNLVADANNDGKISMSEAFNYAAHEDSQNETPLYDDNGDQIGHEEPLPNGGDGNRGTNIYL